MALHVTREDGREVILLGVDEFISSYAPEGWDADPRRKKSLRNSVYAAIKDGKLETVPCSFKKIIKLAL